MKLQSCEPHSCIQIPNATRKFISARCHFINVIDYISEFRNVALLSHTHIAHRISMFRPIWKIINISKTNGTHISMGSIELTVSIRRVYSVQRSFKVSFLLFFRILSFDMSSFAPYSIVSLCVSLLRARKPIPLNSHNQDHDAKNNLHPCAKKFKLENFTTLNSICYYWCCWWSLSSSAAYYICSKWYWVTSPSSILRTQYTDSSKRVRTIPIDFYSKCQSV